MSCSKMKSAFFVACISIFMHLLEIEIYKFLLILSYSGGYCCHTTRLTPIVSNSV